MKCPLCQSKEVSRKRELQKIERWNCHVCRSSFNVLSRTIFQKIILFINNWHWAMMNEGNSDLIPELCCFR
ncbi:MAG: hypothetical protein M2R45_00510 [Verrucomicrobia subdivision 3 bacterium]|nr:hypothetical protein [Limisphaerales bacterium]MCS1413613.1 hypothetical protein [Limisphaerales bacterium]